MMRVPFLKQTFLIDRMQKCLIVSKTVINVECMRWITYLLSCIWVTAVNSLKPGDACMGLMTPTHQALLPGRCSRITGQVVQQAVEVVRLGTLNRTAGWPCKQGFLTLTKMHVKNTVEILISYAFFQRVRLCNCLSISYATIKCC